MIVIASLLTGGVLCLAGSKFFFRSSRQPSERSGELSTSISALQERLSALEDSEKELRPWRRSLETEWEDTYAKFRSMLGRLDRSKRERSKEEAAAPAAPEMTQEAGEAEILRRAFGA
jgi:chromosome segregation ATPase